MTAPQPQGWVQRGDHWGLWWRNRQIACVQPGAHGIRVVLSCRKLWQDKEVGAATIAQGKRYAERWCAARVLIGVPLKDAVAQLVAKDEPARRLSRTEMQQQRRLNAIPNPKL
jgi:hypothetical protein